MELQLPLREQERENWDFFLNIPNPDRSHLKLTHINQQQMQEPLFEFSGACAGCGEISDAGSEGYGIKIHTVLRSLPAGGYAIAIASGGRKRYRAISRNYRLTNS
ncbi:MAG: hypothetical protein ACYTXI_28510 [Nostoc sp.]